MNNYVIKLSESDEELYCAIKQEICFWYCYEEDLQDKYKALQVKYENSGWLLHCYRDLASLMIAFDIRNCEVARKRLYTEKAKIRQRGTRGA